MKRENKIKSTINDLDNRNKIVDSILPMKRMNQELEQYLRFFVKHQQKDWPEWLVLAEFVMNNKTYTAIKVSPFIVNYGRKLRMGGI